MLDFDTPSSDESVIWDADTHLATNLGRTAIGVSVAFGALGLRYSELSTGDDGLTLAVNGRKVFLADADLTAGSVGVALELGDLVGRTFDDGHANTIHSGESSGTDAHLQAISASQGSSDAVLALSLGLFVDLALQDGHADIVDQRSSSFADAHLLACRNAVGSKSVTFGAFNPVDGVGSTLLHRFTNAVDFGPTVLAGACLSADGTRASNEALLVRTTRNDLLAASVYERQYWLAHT